MRRFVALALALSLLSSSVSGCSQPIDTGSSVPPASQPIVALLALIGLGIGLTALHHHNEHRGGGGGGPAIFGAAFSVPPFIPGFKVADLAIDTSSNAGIGVLEVPTGGSGTGTFVGAQPNGNSLSQRVRFPLPAGYDPQALAMDNTGVAWFVDQSGKVEECDATSTTTCVSTIGPFNDGLGTGARSIAADTSFVFVVKDAGAGKVSWWALSLLTGPTSTSNTYQSTSTSPIDATDALESTPLTASGFTVYHQDGSSDIDTFTASGGSLTLNPQTSFTYNPVPAGAPSDPIADPLNSLNIAFYAFTGSTSAAYEIAKYSSGSNAGLGQLTGTTVTIALNGQLSGAPFTMPLSSIHADQVNISIWALDAAGDIVNFTTF